MFGRKSQQDKIGIPPAPPARNPSAQRPSPSQTGPSQTGLASQAQTPAPQARAAQAPGPAQPPQAAHNAASSDSGATNEKTLIVGRGIALSGDIAACDTLVVEGKVEAQLNDARKLAVAETGLFKGTVTVDRAEIGGRLEGTVTVRRHLVIRATGRVEGTVRYGAIEIEQGGVLTGKAETLPASEAAAAPEPAETPAAASSRAS